MKVIFFTLVPDIHMSVALFEGSQVSPALNIMISMEQMWTTFCIRLYLVPTRDKASLSTRLNDFAV